MVASGGAIHCAMLAKDEARQALPNAADVASGARMNIDRRRLFLLAGGLLLCGNAQALGTTAPPAPPANTAPSERPTRAVWTPERIAVLRRMWAENRSATRIARQLGPFTRNAVHRKARLLGLKRPHSILSRDRSSE